MEPKEEWYASDTPAPLSLSARRGDVEKMPEPIHWFRPMPTSFIRFPWARVAAEFRSQSHINIFNQRAPVGYYEFMIPTGDVQPTRALRFSCDPNFDWGKLINVYNYINA